MYASQATDVPTVKFLVEKLGAKIHPRSNDLDWNAIMYAIAAKKFKIAQYLLSKEPTFQCAKTPLRSLKEGPRKTAPFTYNLY